MANHLIHPDFIDAYVYLIKLDGVVRYVGKGRGYRALEHFAVARSILDGTADKKSSRVYYLHRAIAKAMREGVAVEYEVVANGLSDEDAFKREIEEIGKYPQRQLCNIRAGGSGGDRDMMLRLWSDPEFRQRTIAAANKGRSDPKFIERQRQVARAAWLNPSFKEKWMRAHRALWDNPASAAERRALLKKVWSSPQLIEHKRQLVSSQWTPERRKAMSENRRAAWANPEFKARASASIRAAKAKK